MSAAGTIHVNGQDIETPGYLQWHGRRIARTIETLHRMGAQRIVEVGAHPWVMTAMLVDEPGFELCATISAEEVTKWPDDIGVTRTKSQIRTVSGHDVTIPNYSANVERTLFDLGEAPPDTVIASEIIEHLIRAPHVMLLNINRWLAPSGKLLITTPNACQFSNPLRRKTPTAAYRASIYERHSFLYTLDDLVDLVALCGFRVAEAGFWDVYDRHGPARVYRALGRLPWRYCREKFMKTIYVIGEKERDVTGLPRAPRVYDARGDWEFIERRAR